MGKVTAAQRRTMNPGVFLRFDPLKIGAAARLRSGTDALCHRGDGFDHGHGLSFIGRWKGRMVVVAYPNRKTGS